MVNNRLQKKVKGLTHKTNKLKLEKNKDRSDIFAIASKIRMVLFRHHTNCKCLNAWKT